jgi:hypothetical protein
MTGAAHPVPCHRERSVAIQSLRPLHTLDCRIAALLAMTPVESAAAPSLHSDQQSHQRKSDKSQE